MRKFVKFLGGDTNGGSYHSIWTSPAPESGSRAVVEPSSLKKEKQKEKEHQIRNQKLNQPVLAELSDPNTISTKAAAAAPRTTTRTAPPQGVGVAGWDDLVIRPVEESEANPWFLPAELDSPTSTSTATTAPVPAPVLGTTTRKSPEPHTKSTWKSRLSARAESKRAKKATKPLAELSATEVDLDVWADRLPKNRIGIDTRTGKRVLEDHREAAVTPTPRLDPEDETVLEPVPEPETQRDPKPEPIPESEPVQVPKPEPEPEAEPQTMPQPKPRPLSTLDPDLLIFGDEVDAIPVFGRQFGIARPSILREKAQEPVAEPESEPIRQPDQLPTTSPKNFLEQVDQELEALYAEHLKLSGKQRPASKERPTKKKGVKKVKVSSKRKSKPEACIICLEPFGPDGVTAPDTLSLACQHTPSVCYICLSKSIKHDLETKFWDEIKCPECKTLFVHEDIRRFADEETFARYDRISFRHAMDADKNFIWCLECDFGQLHEPGTKQPIVRCLNCSAQSCFKHAIKWHDGFTCDEYDAVLWDPDSYKTIAAKGSSKTTGGLDYMTKKEITRATKTERTRQQKLHEALKKAAKKKQEEEAKRIKEEKKAAAPASATALHEEENTTDSSIQEDIKDDFKEKIEMLKKRMREAELSVKVVEKTTKRCPGCQWPIEKNDGCDHMTCVKCRHEFCWVCLGEWATHTKRCRQ